MGEHVVAAADEIADGERIVVELEGRDVGVFRVGDDYYAYTNWCPHQGGPICEGPVSGTTRESFDRETLESDLEWVREGRILVCPWHGWQFDLVTGAGVHDDGLSLPTHPVRVEDGRVVVEV